ncbi:12849_t:CDS:2, partial [Acaulospora colombiana]
MSTFSISSLPSTFLEFLQANEIDPRIYTIRELPRYIRLNTQHPQLPTREELENQIGTKLWNVDGIDGFYGLDGRRRIVDCQAYKEGKIFGIDLSSGIAVCALDIQPDDHVLDLCCAPGAKLCMASNVLDVKGCGTITGVDVSRERMSTCRSLIRKYRIGGRVRLFVADGTTFDVLAPSFLDPIRRMNNKNHCTEAAPVEVRENVKRQQRELQPFWAPKTLRTDPQIRAPQFLYDKYEKYGWDKFEENFLNPERLNNLWDLQRNLLKNGWSLLKPGGILVYSTCSLSRRQNEDVIEWFLLHYHDAELETVPNVVNMTVAPRKGNDSGSIDLSKILLALDNSMDKFCTEYLRRSALQVLTSAGFEKTSRIAGEVFADVLKDYLICLGKSTQSSAINAGRVKSTSADVLAAFEDLGIDVEELREWAQTEGKNLGSYAGSQPLILKDLLRRGLPGYSVNSESNRPLKIVNKNYETMEKLLDKIQLVSSAEDYSKLESINQYSDSERTMQISESQEDMIDVKKEGEEEMVIDTDGLNENIESLPEHKVDGEIEKLEEKTNDDVKITVNENKLDDTVEMQIDVSINKSDNNAKCLKPWAQVRPSYVPEWLPPFPKIRSLNEEDQEKGDDKKVDDEKPEYTADSVVAKDDGGMDLEMKNASTNSSVNTSHDGNAKTTRRIKRSPDQRPPTYDQFANIYKSITLVKPVVKESETEMTKDEKRKKRKIKVSTSSLFPSHHIFETKFDGCDGVLSPDAPNSLSSSTLFKDIPKKMPIFSYPIPKPNKGVEPKAPLQTTPLSLDSKITEEKPLASRKGKEKMIIDAPDIFENPTPNPLPPKSQISVQRDTKSKTKKSVAPVTSDKLTSKSKKAVQPGTTVLKLRLGTSATPAIASTPSVQTELVINNDTADPPEIINCICPYPLSEIDDGNFMLSCDNCQ